jgi:hypothetical protein
MSWPLASHFSAILQNPKIAFRDPVLKRCHIAKDAREQPRPWSGAFAVVFKGVCPDTGRAFAIRVFTTESPERRERYDLVGDYLKPRQLDCLVDFEYRDGAIRSAGNGKWYPLVLMDWVEGETLFQWVGDRCREGNALALAEAAARWVELVDQLAAAQISHGDLQHANVMVTPAGRLKLVDYDGMCVPALVGRRNLEVGVEPYQHPRRNQATLLSLELDRFSSLLIYVALRALAADPTLWNRYVKTPGHDKLLFRGDDLREPDSSLLIREIGHCREEDVRDLTARLIELARAPMEQVPPLVEFANSFAQVQRLLEDESWAAAVELLNRRGRFRDAPKHLRPLIEEAYRNVCREQAWTEYQAIRTEPEEAADRHLVGGWNEALFARFDPAERCRPRLTDARRRVDLLDRLHASVQQASGSGELADERSIAAVAKELPAGYSFDLKDRVKLAWHRVRAVEGLEEDLANEAGEASLAARWQMIQKLRCERFVAPQLIARVELAGKRLEVLELLRQIPDDLPPRELDRRLIPTWRDDLLEGCREADAWRPAYRAGLARRDLLGRIETLMACRDESAIAELLEDPLLAGYPLPDHWATTVKTVRDRIAHIGALLKALDDDDDSRLGELFDARLIRQNADRFKAHERKLCEWTRSEILSAGKLGLGPVNGRGSLAAAGRSSGAYHLRWIWPEPRFSNQCILAICPDKPDAGDPPGEVLAHHRVAVDRASCQSGGSYSIRFEPPLDGDYVVVWALVDLGFRSFTSRPLVLGRLEVPKRRWPRRWRLRS